MLQRLNVIGLFMALWMVSGTAYAAVTPISGTITEDTVWTAAGGPYRVVGAITVAPGATLTIEGGAIADGEAAEIQFLSNLLKSHKTHFDQTGKGPGITDCNVCHNAKFKDNEPLETTTVCNECHSPTGSFEVADGLMDPVIGAKANFVLGGVYEIDNVTLKPGKEKWCSTCHDSEPSVNSLGGFPETSAPNVVGDNATYGFWQTGHGKSIGNCLECHDASKDHWDNNARTYEVDDTTGQPINPWGDSYRLRTASTKSSEQFCIKCHNTAALSDADGQSNFKDLQSGHNLHIWGTLMQVSRKADTDYDGAADSKPACTTCHNPHGSKSNKMTRTGELASTPGTTDREPGLNQTYVRPATGPFSTATWTINTSSSGTFGVYAWWRYQSNIEKSAKYTINHYSGSDSITIPQNKDGSRWVPLGDYDFQAGTSASVVLSADYTSGKPLIADQIGIDTTGDGIPDLIIDDADPEFSSVNLANAGGEWSYSNWYDGRRLMNEERFDLDVTLAESTAGYVRFTPVTLGTNINLSINKVCNTCHGTKVYNRSPFMGPKILNRFEDRRWALNDGTGSVDIVVSVVDPDDNMAGGSVTIDLSTLGGGSAEVMTDNGDGTYSYQLAIPVDTFDKAYNPVVTAIDAAGNIGTGMSSVYVKSSDDSIYLDNIDASHTYADNWVRPATTSRAYNNSYESTYNYRQYSEADSELTATWKTPVKTAGSYNVYTWLFKGSNNFNSDATYTIEDSSGSTTVSMNQNGVSTDGSWELLGTFNYEEGATATVTVSAMALSTNEILYVDAIKLEPAP